MCTPPAARPVAEFRTPRSVAEVRLQGEPAALDAVEDLFALDAVESSFGVESVLAGTFGNDVAGAGDVALAALEGHVAQGALLADTFHVAGPDREAAAATAIALWASTREPAPRQGALATAASGSSSQLRGQPGATVTTTARTAAKR